MSRAPKVAIIIYTMYGHIGKMAEAVKAGIVAAGGQADILQVPETLPQEVLTLMHAPAKPDYPVLTLDKFTTYDGFVFGIPTRYGMMPAQWKAFWDSTGGLWQAGALFGKYASTFVSTSTAGGGQETTHMTTLTTCAHHGINYIPLGYSFKSSAGDSCFTLATNVDEVHGGSPWGAGTFASATGARQPSALELRMAEMQGEHFWKTISRVRFD
ncbi:NADH-quinone oxidoreductase [Tricholoma matsutake]|nr:NADH-quinone oxidoreductase [Tricholoma matsutake 945]